MSRIHEALKRAEQERATAQRGPAQRGFATPAGERPMTTVEEPLVAAAAGMTGGGVSLGPAMPSFANPFGVDAMLVRCPQLQWKPDEKTMLFFDGDDNGGDDNARGTDEFHVLRSRIYRMREKMALKKIMVTSTRRKEGKSFTAANLAQALLRQRRRVLLIDADLRGPRLHMILGTTSSPGLSDYLYGGTDEFSIMQRGAMENLFFIPSGRLSSDPSELVANGRLKFLLERVEALFDWIIIDSPPAVPASDASMLAQACDGVLMVVRSNAAPVDMARRAREGFPDQTLVGVVLNGTDHESSPYSRCYFEAYVKNLT